MSSSQDTLFANLITNRGISIGELSQHHRIILLFIKFIGCPVCQITMDALTKWTPSLLQLNTIPVICHPESEEFFQEFCAKHPKKFYLHPEMIRLAHVSMETKHQLGIGSASLMKHLKAMPMNFKLAIKEHRVMHIPFSLGLEKMKSDFAMFLVEKSQVINRVIFHSFCDRPDYAKFVLDLDFYFDVNAGDYQARIEQLFPKLLSLLKQDKRASLFDQKEFQLRHNSLDSISLDTILDVEQNRKLFKRFTMKEHSLENVLFVEQVMEYKKLQQEEERQVKAKQILNSFFGTNSLFQININEEVTKHIQESIDSCSPKPDLFDDVLTELKSTVLADSFMRFKTHISFDEVALQ